MTYYYYLSSLSLLFNLMVIILWSVFLDCELGINRSRYSSGFALELMRQQSFSCQTHLHQSGISISEASCRLVTANGAGFAHLNK